MSRAYCLTCNEKVHETPSGTCPLGHPVAAEDRGPEPWVGFAGDTDDTDVAAVPMQHLDAAGRPREHVGAGHRTNGQHHVNGSANGHARSLAHEMTPSTNGTGHTAPPETPPSSSIDDDLTALLADALRDNAPQEPAADHEPPVDLQATDTAPDDVDTDSDWGELASLAAQLHLDDDVATDDGPAARTEELPDEPTTELAAADVPSDERPDELSAANIDDLLAELTGDATADEPDVAAPTPPAPLDDPAPFDAAVPEPAPPPPPPPPAQDTSIWDEPAAHEDVRSAPAADPADIWAEPDEVPTEDTPPATTVDLYNFTARGKRVGEAGAARPARKKRGRKR